MAGVKTQGLDHVAIAVRDLDRSERFYSEILGLERAHEDEWHVPRFMIAPGEGGVGGSGLALFPDDSHPSSGDPSEVPAIRVLHVAFRVDRATFDSARSTLPERGLEVQFSDHGACHSIYFEDPDGHEIELTTYEVER